MDSFSILPPPYISCYYKLSLSSQMGFCYSNYIQIYKSLKFVFAPYDYHCIYQCSSLSYSKSLTLFPMSVAVLLLAFVHGYLPIGLPVAATPTRASSTSKSHHNHSDLHNLHGTLLGPVWGAECTGLLHNLSPFSMNFSLPGTLTYILRLASYCISLLGLSCSTYTFAKAILFF